MKSRGALGHWDGAMYLYDAATDVGGEKPLGPCGVACGQRHSQRKARDMLDSVRKNTQ